LVPGTLIPRVKRVNDEYVFIEVPNPSKRPESTITIVMKNQDAMDLRKILNQYFEGWIVSDYLPTGEPHNMHSHIDPANLDLNIGGH
jgi:hypothetical protein